MRVSFWCSSIKSGFHPGAARSFEASTPLCAGVNSEDWAPVCAMESVGRSAAATAPARTPARINSRRFMKAPRVEPLRLGKLVVHQVAEEALAHEATLAGRGHPKVYIKRKRKLDGEPEIWT